MSEQEQLQSGVNNEGTVPAAGGQSDELDLESLLFGDGNETGDTKGDADQEVIEEQGEEQEQTQEQELPTEDASKAFAAKWAAEKHKIRDEVKEELMSELAKQTQNTPNQQRQGAPQYREMSPQELEKLADEWETSPAVVRILHQQQQLINRQAEEARRMSQMSRERSEYSEAQKYANRLVADNPSMPAWDDKKVHEYRMNYYKNHGTTLPWKEAYRALIVDAVVSGDITRKAQQDTIQKVIQRDTEAVPLKPAANKQSMTINDLSDEQFSKLREQVLAGKYKRS